VLVGIDDKSGDFKFERVISFLDRIENIDASFIRLSYNVNDTINNFITLTPRHLIFTQRDGYIPANTVKIGDRILLLKQNKYIKVYVNKIEELNLKNSGIYAPLTESGEIIVNNIKCSCYSMVKSHKLTQFIFNSIHFFIGTFNSQTVYDYIIQNLYCFISYFNLKNIILNL
jgi:hypothetical protein